MVIAFQESISAGKYFSMLHCPSWIHYIALSVSIPSQNAPIHYRTNVNYMVHAIKMEIQNTHTHIMGEYEQVDEISQPSQ